MTDQEYEAILAASRERIRREKKPKAVRPLTIYYGDGTMEWLPGAQARRRFPKPKFRSLSRAEIAAMKQEGLDVWSGQDEFPGLSPVEAPIPFNFNEGREDMGNGGYRRSMPRYNETE